ncbi:MAG: hypothetical protein IPK26_01455 [Planctomycetes bacterium]|nr:hypothetical protein [Planctomycetota bacterium]
MAATRHPPPTWFLIFAGLAACSGSNTTTERMLARGTIGPEGGTISVPTGNFAGVTLTLAAGAVDRPTTIELHGDDGVRATTYLPPLSHPLRIEPANLMFPADTATLRHRFYPRARPGAIDLAVWHTDADRTVTRIPPAEIDRNRGLVDCRIASLGRFRIDADRIANLEAWLGTPPTTLLFDDGSELAIDVDFDFRGGRFLHAWEFHLQNQILTVFAGTDWSTTGVPDVFDFQSFDPDRGGIFDLMAVVDWSTPVSTPFGSFADVIHASIALPGSPNLPPLEVWMTEGVGPVQYRIHGGPLAQLTMRTQR